MSKQGGMELEITLRDEAYHPVIREKININDKKKMRELMEQLKNKGVHFPIRWFD